MRNKLLTKHCRAHFSCQRMAQKALLRKAVAQEEEDIAQVSPLAPKRQKIKSECRFSLTTKRLEGQEKASPLLEETLASN